MMVQWQLVDIETKEVLALSTPFDFEEVLKKEEELLINGKSSIKNPVGILGGTK